MDNIAGQKTSLGLVTNITVLVLVILWLIPTVGLLVSSFRDRDQISESGWWQAPLPVEQVFRTRAPADGVTAEELSAAADERLYRAKRQGRNRICSDGAGSRSAVASGR